MISSLSEDISFGSLKVLVVDDLPTNCKVLSHLLTKLGSQVETCNSGEAALQLCSEKKYHLVLLDLHMPSMSGFETGEKLIESREGSTPLIVAQTADETPKACERTTKIGFDGHLTKPIRPDRVSKFLNQALSLSEPCQNSPRA